MECGDDSQPSAPVRALRKTSRFLWKGMCYCCISGIFNFSELLLFRYQSVSGVLA